MTYNLPLNTTQIPIYLRKIADIPQFQTWMKNRIGHLPDVTISAAEYENQCEAALLLSAGIPKNRVVLEELFAGEQSLNTITCDLLYVMKLYEAATAGVATFIRAWKRTLYACAAIVSAYPETETRR